MRQSKTKLVQDLLALPEHPNRAKIIQKAKAGYYHPDTTQLGNPKHQCAADLCKLRFWGLANRVEAGEYD